MAINYRGTSVARNLGMVAPVRTFGSVTAGNVAVFEDATGRRIKDGGTAVRQQDFSAVPDLTEEPTYDEVVLALRSTLAVLKGAATIALAMLALVAGAQTSRLGSLRAGDVVVTNEQDGLAYPVATNALALAQSALQPAATNGMLTAEADTLATVTARGATTPNSITAQNFIGGRYGAGAGESASGSDCGAYGVNAGAFASGNAWGAYGIDAGGSANGNAWGAYGCMAGLAADHNNSHAFGHYAGYAARGDSRLYIDVYAAEPEYAANGAINDRIFGDTDGKLYLGRGEGAPGGAVGGTLRGPWTGGGFASYLDTTNIAAAAVAASPVWLDRTGLSGTVEFVNDAGSPQAWSGTGALTVSGFSGLQPPAQVYWTLYGFDSVTLPASTYVVGGGAWQANMVNHFTVWQVGTNVMLNFITATEVD